MMKYEEGRMKTKKSKIIITFNLMLLSLLAVMATTFAWLENPETYGFILKADDIILNFKEVKLYNHGLEDISVNINRDEREDNVFSTSLAFKPFNDADNLNVLNHEYYFDFVVVNESSYTGYLSIHLIPNIATGQTFVNQENLFTTRSNIYRVTPNQTFSLSDSVADLNANQPNININNSPVQLLNGKQIELMGNGEETHFLIRIDYDQYVFDDIVHQYYLEHGTNGFTNHFVYEYNFDIKLVLSSTILEREGGI